MRRLASSLGGVLLSWLLILQPAHAQNKDQQELIKLKLELERIKEQVQQQAKQLEDQQIILKKIQQSIESETKTEILDSTKSDDFAQAKVAVEKAKARLEAARQAWNALQVVGRRIRPEEKQQALAAIEKAEAEYQLAVANLDRLKARKDQELKVKINLVEVGARTAEARLKLMESKYVQLKKLVEQGFATKQELEALELQLQQARADLEVQRLKLNALKAQLKKAPAKKSAPLMHTVIFYLKKDAGKNAVAEMTKDCHQLLAKIPSVRKLWVGKPIKETTPEVGVTDYHLGLAIAFDDAKGLKAYLVHKLHLKFVENHQDKIQKVIVYDFQTK